ncbi:MAG: MFS transporter [Polyangiaceae bacterium]|jgi:PPP family 3-phenylpropionic acid transporter
MRRVATLCVYYFMAFAVGGAYLPYFPRWLEARGMLGTRLGMISAAGPATGMVAPLVIGVLADRMGLRGGLLQVAWAGALATLAALTALAYLHVPLGFVTLFAAALLLALFRSPTTLVADVLALEHTAAGTASYGRVRLWGSIGFMTTAVVVPYVMDPADSLQFPLGLTAITLSALVAALALPSRAGLPARTAPEAWRSLWIDADVRLFCLTAFLYQCGHVAYDLCFTLHLLALGAPRTTVGLAWAIGTGSEVILMAAGARIFAVQSPASILAWGLAGASARWVLVAAIRSPSILLALQPLHAISFAVVWLALVRFASRRFPAQLLGTAQGTLSTSMGAGSVLGMVLWGAVFSALGGAAVFAGAACFCGCATLCALSLRRGEFAPPTRLNAESIDGSGTAGPNSHCGSQTS